jgi:cellulose synthase/poly-beta-1,6-N-acetylglucosamine synthase-like glycosyltransferase
MITVAELVVLVLNLAVLPYFLLLLAVALAAIFVKRVTHLPGEPTSRFLVVIPAHDEEEGIANTVVSCLASNYPDTLFQVLVIADNCSDQTASVASNAGARVLERFDKEKKSKGFAIEYLIAELQRSGEFDRLDALVIIDADTTIDRDLLRRFDRGLGTGQDWIQCYYTVANPDQSWRTRLMTYAFGLFNGVMPFGMNGLGASAGFRGNGMCFSTRGLRRIPWACYGLVEDMEFSWVLRISGEWVAFDPEVSVRGAMLGSGGKAAANQRRRWEFGRSEIRKKYLKPILRSDKLGWWERVLLACELTLPTMSSLLMVYIGLMVANATLFAWAVLREEEVIPAILLCLSIPMTLALALYAFSPFLALKMPWSTLKTLAFAPVYLVWKLLVSLGGRPTEWIRTARESSIRK